MSQLELDKDLPLIDDLPSLFLSGVAMIDVRAPVEFNEGAFPQSTNLPLMSDADREAIGKRYKDAGQDEAIALGLQRVSGDIKSARVQAWEAFARSNPTGVLYCFRGGLRSKISQQWLYQHTGIRFPRVHGGYKAMRRFLLDQLQHLPEKIQPLILGGRTGSGKTQLLKTFAQHIDLEGLANHRGSAFGGYVSPQPTQISFENTLAIQLLRHVHARRLRLILEDECRQIGSRHIPKNLYSMMADAPIVMIEVADEERIENSFQEYVMDAIDACNQWCDEDDEAGHLLFKENLLTSLNKIQRRLGGDRYKHVSELMQNALALQANTGDAKAHYEWVRFLLINYYDPMYDYQMDKKQERLLFKGTPAEVKEYLVDQGVV